MNQYRQPKTIIAILGMHRSGTSMLTGSLQECGLELGKYHTWNRHNRKGNRENQDIVNLHDAILAANNGSWEAPPERIDWNESLFLEGQRILDTNSKYHVWGFKDPRTLLLLSYWKHMCPEIQFIGIFRHPVSVANSLSNRNKFTEQEGLELWYQYNSLLLLEFSKKPFPILSFDWEIGYFYSRLDKIASLLKLTPNASNKPFYNPSLHHHNCLNDSNLPDKILNLYSQLNDVSKIFPSP